MKCNNAPFTAVIAILLISFLSLCMPSLPAYAQEQTKKIPFEVIEDRQVEEKPAGNAEKHRMAMGVNIDPYPTIISAASGYFGLAMQPWFGIDHFKLRIDISHLRIPDAIAATHYFYKNDINSFTFILEYTFGENFDGFKVGAGPGIWNGSISHKFLSSKAMMFSPYLKVEGGYIWQFHKNLYIEPCLALDIMLLSDPVYAAGFKYKPIPLFGEITLKFGLFVDI